MEEGELTRSRSRSVVQSTQRSNWSHGLHSTKNAFGIMHSDNTRAHDILAHWLQPDNLIRWTRHSHRDWIQNKPKMNSLLFWNWPDPGAGAPPHLAPGSVQGLLLGAGAEAGQDLCPGLGPDLDPGVVPDQGEILGTVIQPRLLLKRLSSWWRLMS